MDINSEEDIILDTENVVDNNIESGVITVEEDIEDDMIDDCIDMEDDIVNLSKPVIIDKENRVSKNKMTRYEFVRIIGERTKQLTMGAKPMIKQSKNSEPLTYSEIAIEELKLNMTPFKIRRPIKDHYEIWSIDELDKKHLESLF